MKGKLYQILGNGIEKLYWSASQGQEGFIRNSYKIFQKEIDKEDYEDWFKKCYEMQINRVFVEEIYI